MKFLAAARTFPVGGGLLESPVRRDPHPCPLPRSFRMNREKFAWLGSVLLIAVLAFQIPGTLPQRDDDYAFVRTLVDIHRQVQQNYVDSTDEAALREAAISGMLSKLDPFSV